MAAHTVSMEALLAQLVSDASEERRMAIFDVPGTYLNVDMPKDKFVLFKSEDEFVDIICEFIKDVQQEGKKIIIN